MSITASELLEAGWKSGPDIGKALRLAEELAGRGVTDRAYLLKLIERDIPKPADLPGQRPQPAPLAEAIEAEGPEDAENIGACRRFMQQLLRCPRIERGALMPDACPAGQAAATIPVGGAIAVHRAIIPSAHSADICCSMYASFFPSDQPAGPLLDHLMASTRFGMGGRAPGDEVHHPVLDEPVWDNPFLRGLELAARVHIADQGDGNHFAFLGKVNFTTPDLAALAEAGHGDLAERLARRNGRHTVLVTHHGSRSLGAKLYTRGQNAAMRHTARVAQGIPPAAAWLDFDTPEGQLYWEALQYVSRWTLANHQSIHTRFLHRLGVRSDAQFGNEHNFVWRRGEDTFLHGKGATPAWKDGDGRPLLGLIPLNMASPILMVLGSDNAEFLSVCPHGAGRNRSRRATLRPFLGSEGTPDEKLISQAIARDTAGLDIRWFTGKADLSETPMGYKPAGQVRGQIERFGLARLVAEIQPMGCIMAGDPGPAPWRRKGDDLTPKQVRQIAHRAERRTVHQELRSARNYVETETGDDA